MNFLLAIGAGTLLAAAFPPYHVPSLLPLGIALLALALRGASLRQAFYLGLTCGAIYMGGTLFWLGNLFGAAAVSLCAIAAAFPTLFSVAFVWLEKRLPRVPPWLLAGVAWAGIEYFRSEPFPLNFGWSGLGYAVAGRTAFAPLASVVGSYGISFAVVALGVWASARPKRLLAIVPLWTVLCLVPTPPRPATDAFSVRLVQAFADEDSLFQLSRTPADLIVWPEYALTSDDPVGDKTLWARLEDVARTNRAWFVFGGKRKTGVDAFENTAFVLSPRGELVGRHVKNHLVHFIREGTRGTTANAIPTDLGRLGVAICFDMDYPDVARRLAADGASVLIVPNMDPGEWGDIQRAQHRLMFAMRAMECGRWLARADVAGGTSVVAPDGRETARVATSEPTALDARVGRETAATLYVRGGWRFGQLCLAALIAALVWASIPSPRRRPGLETGGRHDVAPG